MKAVQLAVMKVAMSAGKRAAEMVAYLVAMKVGRLVA